MSLYTIKRRFCMRFAYNNCFVLVNELKYKFASQILYIITHFCVGTLIYSFAHNCYTAHNK